MRITSLLGAVTLGSTLSYIVERLQCYTVSRVPSWIDVVTNFLGTTLAALLILCFEPVVRGAILKMRAAVRNNWWSGFSKALVCAIILINLRPYDIAGNVKHALANTLRAIQNHDGLSIFARWNNLRALAFHAPDPLIRMQWEYLFERVGEIALYAALAATLALAYQKRGRLSLARHAGIGIGILALASMITGIRCVLISYGLDTMHMACALIAWPLGTLILAKRLRNSETASTRFPAAILAGMTLIVAYDLVPFDWTVTEMARAAGPDGVTRSMQVAGNRLNLLPFAAHMQTSPNIAFSNMTGDLLRYGCLGVGATLLISRSRRLRVLPWRAQLLTCGLFGLVCSVAMESMHLLMPSRASDITTVLLAIVGTCSGCIAMKWISAYRAAAKIVIANDLLTSQLIEGETYKPERVTAPGSSHDGASRKDLDQAFLRG
jgi:glycopeptide antibiotics resistance protein